MTLDPTTILSATAPDGTILTASTHGGQIIAWRPAGGSDRLWLSPLATGADGAAIRGGVPVIFPRFAAHPLTDAMGNPIDVPRHGFARTETWLVEEVPDDTAAVLGATLRDTDRTRGAWPHAFALALVARATSTTLTLTLDVANPGPEPFAFSAALHTYLRVSDAAAAAVTGLGPEPRPALGPVDEVHQGAAENVVVLTDRALSALAITANGFPDMVFWNPGLAYDLADVPEDGALRFVCLEAVVLTPIVLAPGETWTGTQALTTA